MAKRTLDAFFQTPNKKARTSFASPITPSHEPEAEDETPVDLPTNHGTYPFAVADLPPGIVNELQQSPATPARHISDRPHLDLLHYQPLITHKGARLLFNFLRAELFFYRVKYKIKRGPVETDINTPRWTTVFGVDESSRWHQPNSDIEVSLLETSTGKPIDSKKYARQPRPIPGCLETLRRATEAVTGETFNFCLVNYYADGNDSISYHSDDERFLGPNPSIASFSLGSSRDFLMRPKPQPKTDGSSDGRKEDEKPLKLTLSPGDMVLMRGETQGKWLHSIPKRKRSGGGRINITFRKALVKGGSENYYQYNVGAGEPYRWNGMRHEMIPLKDFKTSTKD